MKARIAAINAMEILDSRGNPTVRVMLALDDGTVVQASVPSGASTGENEALELRDGDKTRYGGKGVLTAVANVVDEIAPALRGIDPSHQARDRPHHDRARRHAGQVAAGRQRHPRGVDGGGARRGEAADLPLYAYLGGGRRHRLPVPMMNVINGGTHADNSLDFQEFMIVPHGAPSFARGAALRRRDVPRAEGHPAQARPVAPRSATRAASRPNLEATKRPAS